MYVIAADTYKFLKPLNSFAPLTWIIAAVFCGFLLGLFLSYYNKTYIGETVRRLIRAGAHAKESAKTLGELGLKPSFLRKNSLKDCRLLRKYVELSDADGSFPEKDTADSAAQKKRTEYDFEKMRMYIPEEKKYTADVRFEQKRKISPAWLAILALLIVIVCVACVIAAPHIFRIIDNLLSGIFNKQ